MAKKKGEERNSGIGRVPSGISGLDKLIQGGFERNNSILLKGASGVGKTIFALQYLYEGAVEYGEPGLYISFGEFRDAIIQRGAIFGWDFEDLEKKEKFIFARYEPHEIKGIVSSGGGSLRDMIESHGIKRLVIDSLTAYMMLFENEYEANRSVLELFEMLHGMSCTTLVTSEDPITPTSAPTGRVGFLTDGIIHLYNIRKGSKRARAFEVVKMRNTDHTTSLCKFEISGNGIVVHGDDSVDL
jgi:KaiC/GvpD/RAD55 family RecA-like ATPase